MSNPLIKLPGSPNSTLDEDIQPRYLAPDTMRLWLDHLPAEDAHTRMWSLLSLRKYLTSGRFDRPGEHDNVARTLAQPQQLRTLMRDTQSQWTETLQALPRDVQRDARLIDQLGPTVCGIELGTPLALTMAVTVAAALILPAAAQSDAVQFGVLSVGMLAALGAGQLRTAAAARAARRQGGTFRVGWPVWSPTAAQSLQRVTGPR